MKKLFLVIFLFKSLYPCVGCMSNKCEKNGHYCTDRLHYVKCTCPCDTIIDKEGRCPLCGHVGAPNRHEVMYNLDFRYQ